MIDGARKNDIDGATAEAPSTARLIRGRRADRPFADEARGGQRAELLQLRHAIDRASDAVVVAEPNGRIVFVNAAFERLFEIDAAAAIGATLGELTSGAMNCDSDVDACIRELACESAPTEVFFHARDGRTLALHARTSAVVDDEGETVGILWIAQNVTATKQLEEHFRQAQKMEAVALLVGGIVHDFNNLLSIILNNTTLIMEGMSEDDPLRENVAEIDVAGRHATDLARQVLSFGRSQKSVPQSLDLSAALATMEKMLSRVLGRRIVLRNHHAPALWTVCVDLVQIEQIVMNLAVNARDAMPLGGTLTIELANILLDDDHVRRHPDAKVGPHVMLVVTDNGTGMDERTLAHAFEPFYTTKAPGKGTGLGLYTIHSIVQRSGGSICVSSKPGQGTTFNVYFPARKP